MLSSHIRLGLPIGLFLSGFPTKTLYTPLPSLKYYKCPAQPIILDFITRKILGEKYRSWNSTLFLCHHSKAQIFSSTSYSQTQLSLRSSLNVSDQVSHPNKTTGKIIVLYILLLKFLDSKLEEKTFCTEW
jgi:hypothetical protein